MAAAAARGTMSLLSQHEDVGAMQAQVQRERAPIGFEARRDVELLDRLRLRLRQTGRVLSHGRTLHPG